MASNKTAGQLLSGTLFALSVTACTVGPDFVQPSPPDIASYTSIPVSRTIVSSPAGQGNTQHIIEGKQINTYWWHEFGSSKLNGLISAALDNNPTLKASEATLRQAKALYTARAGSSLYPQINASMGNQRQRFNPEAIGQNGEISEFTLYNTGINLQYSFDLSGGNRRALEALAAKSNYQQYQLDGVRLTLAAKITSNAIIQASLTKQIMTMDKILDYQNEQLKLARERYRLGQIRQIEVLSLQTQMEQTRARIPALHNQLQQTNHQLAVLAGQAPGAGTIPSFVLDEFILPRELPLVIPSELVRTRPDILGSEALLHAANAEYGIAISRLYPQLTLSADMGFQALSAGALFGSNSAVWTLIGQLTQPLFNPGLAAEKRAALAALDAAAANYQAVVLESLRSVADTLRTLENDADRLTALEAANTASHRALEVTENRYRLGTASYHELLVAQEQSKIVELELITGQANRLINSVAFFQAMGGGVSSSLALIQ